MNIQLVLSFFLISLISCSKPNRAPTIQADEPTNEPVPKGLANERVKLNVEKVNEREYKFRIANMGADTIRTSPINTNRSPLIFYIGDKEYNMRGWVDLLEPIMIYPGETYEEAFDVADVIEVLGYNLDQKARIIWDFHGYNQVEFNYP